MVFEIIIKSPVIIFYELVYGKDCFQNCLWRRETHAAI